MIVDHIGFAVADFARSRAFYERALAPLGIRVLMQGEGWAMMGRDKPEFWFGRHGTPPGAIHLAFAAADREQVRAFHAAALAAGGRDNGGLGVRAQYHPDYYGAFAFDPDGHNVEAVCHRPEPAIGAGVASPVSGGAGASRDATGARRYTMTELNAMSAEQFSAAFGKVYEHSPWIAERALARRPFARRIDLQLALAAVVSSASRAEQIALLNVHPELAGKEARAGTMTVASVGEQASAGLDALSPAEFARLAELNRAYREKFGFPAIIAVRLNSKSAIFHAFEGRHHNDVEQELQNNLAQVGEIARLRLHDLVAA